MKKIFLIIAILVPALSAQAQWVNTGTEFTSPGSGWSKTQLAEHGWSGSHAILFNAYKDINVNGSLLSTGNTKYTYNAGPYVGGAGSIMFFGNGGNMDFLISPISTGKDTDVNWGTPKMRITRSGRIGIGTATPQAKLDIIHSGTIGGKFNESGAYLKLTSGSYSLLMDNNEIYSNESLVMGASFSHDIRFRNVSTTEHQELMTIKSNGRVGIGTTSPTEQLSVNGSVRSKEVKVEAAPWPDYVFKADYDLQSLSSVSDFIAKNGHLPNIPSAAEVAANGIALGEMNAKLLEKIEELTLHTIHQETKLQSQEELIKTLIKRIENLEN